MPRTRATKRTLRKMVRIPIARELTKLANTLQSAKLHAIAEKVARVEADASVLHKMLDETAAKIAQNTEPEA